MNGSVASAPETDIDIASDGLRVAISTQGAEVRRIVDADGCDLLWDGDPAYWAGRAPILFPIVGMLADGHYMLDDIRYGMPKHGFARHSRFTVAEQDSDHVVLRLAASEATHKIYPFDFRLDLAFRVDGAVLTMTASLANPDLRRDLPASFGFHPALRWPLPYGDARSDHVVRFDRPEPDPIRRIRRDGLVRPDPMPTPVDDHMLVLRDALFVDDALIFDRLHSRGLWYGATGGKGVRVEFPDMPELGIWTKPGAGYVCIEPWQGMADPAGFGGDFRAKPGVISVPPGGTRHFTMRLEFGVSA